MNITDRAATAQIIQATTTTGATPVKAVADAHAHVVKLAAEVRGIGVAQGAIGQAVAEALDRGDDPAADSEVQRLLAATQISGEGTAQAVDAIVFEAFREAVHENADALVKSWQQPFDKAAATLATAHQAIGDLALDDHIAIMVKGGDIAKVWGDARNAADTIGRIVMGWSALGEVAHLASRDQRWNALRLAAVDPAAFGAIDPRKITPWEAVLAGLDLSLPSFEQYHQRVRAIEQAAARAQHDAQGDALDHATGRQRPATIPG